MKVKQNKKNKNNVIEGAKSNADEHRKKNIQGKYNTIKQKKMKMVNATLFLASKLLKMRKN